jgi:hypothetical protein
VAVVADLDHRERLGFRVVEGQIIRNCSEPKSVPVASAEAVRA